MKGSTVIEHRGGHNQLVTYRMFLPCMVSSQLAVHMARCDKIRSSVALADRLLVQQTADSATGWCHLL